MRAGETFESAMGGATERSEPSHQAVDCPFKMEIRFHDCGQHGFGEWVDVMRGRSAASIFVSHHWLSACAGTWGARRGDRVAEFRIGGASGPPTAIALIGRATVWRWGFLRSRMLALNESLDPKLDDPTVELNGFYGAPAERFPELFESLIAGLSVQRDWDEIKLPGLREPDSDRVRALAERYGLRVRLAWDAPDDYVDLDLVRAQHRGNYLAAVSGNTRSQLRRARRGVESEIGPLSVHVAGSVEQALTFLDELGVHHRARWASENPGRQFENPEFVDFHRRLIASAFPFGHVQLLRVDAGERPIGYLYSLVWEDRVCSILMGFDYAVGERFKPGVLAHWMAIEHNLALGAKAYDFLAGENRYKSSLSTGRYRQHWLVLWRPRLRLRLESAVRAAVRRARQGTPREHAESG